MESEGKGTGGGDAKLERRETEPFRREMQPTAGAASGMLPGGSAAPGTEHTGVTWESRTSVALAKPFASEGGPPDSRRKRQR